MRPVKMGIPVFVIAELCVGGVSVCAQAPAGPMTQTTASSPAATAPANTASGAKAPAGAEPLGTRNLTGSWKLNKDESTQPKKREDDDSGSGQHGGGRRSGACWPGGDRGGHGDGGMHRGGISDDERKEMQELMRPSETLEFAQDGAAIVVTDELARHRTFYTDGRKVKKSKYENNQEFDATWQEYRLVSVFKGPDGDKIERTFELLDGNQQLRETIHFTVGRSRREVYLRYVYEPNHGGTSASK